MVEKKGRGQDGYENIGWIGGSVGEAQRDDRHRNDGKARGVENQEHDLSIAGGIFRGIDFLELIHRLQPKRSS